MDYLKMASTAKRLIQEKGRQITLSTINPNSYNPVQPWKGAVFPRDPNTNTQSVVYAVSVPLAAANSLGLRSDIFQLFSETKNVYLVEPGAFDLENPDEYSLVIDSGLELKITFIEKLKPGGVTLLYFIGASS